MMIMNKNGITLIIKISLINNENFSANVFILFKIIFNTFSIILIKKICKYLDFFFFLFKSN